MHLHVSNGSQRVLPLWYTMEMRFPVAIVQLGGDVEAPECLVVAWTVGGCTRTMVHAGRHAVFTVEAEQQIPWT